MPAIAFGKKWVYIVHPSFRVYAVSLTIHTNRIIEKLNAASNEAREAQGAAIASQEQGSGCLPASSPVFQQFFSPLNSVRRASARRLDSLRPSGQVSF
jgi:hypothetical protein